MFLELLRSMHGPRLLRVKGVVKLAEMPDTPLVIHGVQHVFHPPARLAACIRELFDAFLGLATPDRPDQAALTDNPLVPFGGRDR